MDTQAFFDFPAGVRHVVNMLERRKGVPTDYLIIKITIPGVGHYELSEQLFRKNDLPLVIWWLEDEEASDPTFKREQVIDQAIAFIENLATRPVREGQDELRDAKFPVMRLELNITGNAEDPNIIRWHLLQDMSVREPTRHHIALASATRKAG